MEDPTPELKDPHPNLQLYLGVKAGPNVATKKMGCTLALREELILVCFIKASA